MAAGLVARREERPQIRTKLVRYFQDTSVGRPRSPVADDDTRRRRWTGQDGCWPRGDETISRGPHLSTSLSSKIIPQTDRTLIILQRSASPPSPRTPAAARRNGFWHVASLTHWRDARAAYESSPSINQLHQQLLVCVRACVCVHAHLILTTVL